MRWKRKKKEKKKQFATSGSVWSADWRAGPLGGGVWMGFLHCIEFGYFRKIIDVFSTTAASSFFRFLGSLFPSSSSSSSCCCCCCCRFSLFQAIATSPRRRGRSGSDVGPPRLREWRRQGRRWYQQRQQQRKRLYPRFSFLWSCGHCVSIVFSAVARRISSSFDRAF